MVSETRRLAMRRAHTKHASFCSCGKIVHGNGAYAAHRAMHVRRADGHRFILEAHYRERFPRGAPADVGSAILSERTK